MYFNLVMTTVPSHLKLSLGCVIQVAISGFRSRVLLMPTNSSYCSLILLLNKWTKTELFQIGTFSIFPSTWYLRRKSLYWTQVLFFASDHSSHLTMASMVSWLLSESNRTNRPAPGALKKTFWWYYEDYSVESVHISVRFTAPKNISSWSKTRPEP